MDFSMKLINHTCEGIRPPPTHAIRHRAEKLELEEAKKFEISPKHLHSLGNLLDEVYTMLLPSREDYEARKTLIAFVDKFANHNIHGISYNPSGASARAFGSYTMNLFTSGSDLDLSVNLGYTGDVLPRENKIKALRMLSKALHRLQGRGMVRGVLPVLRATVPVLKFVDCRSRVECDISIENKDGILKSEMLRIFSSIDKRFQKLCYLMKAWAKAHDINSSRDRTLNSLSIILLVALHLQTRSPPILPAFSLLFEDESDISEVEKRIRQYTNFGDPNKESIAELFISLLCKLVSVESLWQEALCASTYEGNWISKKLEDKISCISVEDFTARNQNAARSVKRNECETIYNCIKETLHHLQRYLKGLSEASDLKAFLFGPDFESKNTLGQSHQAGHQDKGKRSMPFGDRADQKKMRFSDGQRDGSAVGKLAVMHSGVEGRNYISRIGESGLGNAACPVPRSPALPMLGYGQSKEQAWGARSSQWQDPGPGPRYPPFPDWQQGLWQGQEHGPRYRQGYCLPHELSQLNRFEARYLDSFQNGLRHQMSHLTPLEARFAGPFQNGQVHEMPPMIPFESRFPNLFHNGQAHQMSHLAHLEARFANPLQNGLGHPLQNGPANPFQNNWNLNRLSQW